MTQGPAVPEPLATQGSRPADTQIDPTQLPLDLYFDGWYRRLHLAETQRSYLQREGATVIGIVYSTSAELVRQGHAAGYGILYRSPVELFDNHRLTKDWPT